MLGLLQPVLRPYDWGSTTFIPSFLGLEATGEPVAEAWFGAHPSAPSMIETVAGPRPLTEVVDGLPYLVKVLAAAHPLSIQVHPSARQAAAGFAREKSAGIPIDAPERLYRDPNAKPEAILALEPFDLLHGFREPADTAALIRDLGCGALGGVTGHLERDDSESLRGAAVAIATMTTAQRRSSIAAVVEGCARITEGRWQDTCRWLDTLGRSHPDDIGVLFALLMNQHRLEPLQACFLPARTLHAYLRGSGIEVMGNSDNVLRAGLTPKVVAIDELMEIVDYSPSTPEVLDGPRDSAAGCDYPIPAGDFSLSLFAEGESRVEVAGPEILVSLRGSSVIDSAAGEQFDLPAGSALFVGADTGAYTVTARGRLVRAS